MYTGLTHTHVLMSALFLFALLLKTVFLLSGNDEMLERFKRKFKIPEIIVDSLMLLTGIYLAFSSGWTTHGSWFWIKMAAFLAAVPMSVIAFKKQNKAMALLSLLLLLYAYGISETKSPVFNKKAALVSDETPAVAEGDNLVEAGAAIFHLDCARCHGNDGRGGKSGAPNLRESKMTAEEVMARIRKGKNAMPGYEGYLDDKQIEALAAYIGSLGAQ